MFAYGSNDATCHPKTVIFLASLKPGMVLPFCYRLTQILLKEAVLSRCELCTRVCSSVNEYVRQNILQHTVKVTGLP